MTLGKEREKREKRGKKKVQNKSNIYKVKTYNLRFTFKIDKKKLILTKSIRVKENWIQFLFERNPRAKKYEQKLETETIKEN